jgi:hypothetical protein
LLILFGHQSTKTTTPTRLTTLNVDTLELHKYHHYQP